MFRPAIAIGLTTLSLAACTPTDRVVLTPQPVVATPSPAPVTGARRITREGGSYVLPDGTQVAINDRGGFTLPNGEVVIRERSGALILPNGSRCVPEAGGFTCP